MKKIGFSLILKKKQYITKNKYKVETLTQSVFTDYLLIKKWTVFLKFRPSWSRIKYLTKYNQLFVTYDISTCIFTDDKGWYFYRVSNETIHKINFFYTLCTKIYIS